MNQSYEQLLENVSGKLLPDQNSEADALIIDLEDSVAMNEKAGARSVVADMLRYPASCQKRFVRVNALDTGMTLADLVAVMPHAPDGIVLPKCEGPEDIKQLAYYLAALEAVHGLGETPILAIVTETANALFSLGQYKNADPRLWGMMWGAEDLAASFGAVKNSSGGAYNEPFRMARNLCLAGAAAAGVVAVDSICATLDNLDLVKVEAEEARRDGFSTKAVIHPKHVPVVNSAFTPSQEEIAWARKVIDAFSAEPRAGVVQIDGKMIDKPHERSAQNIIRSI